MKATAQMGGLTREKIEALRGDLQEHYWSEKSVMDEIDALCDLALQAIDRWVPVRDDESLGAYLTGIPGKPIYAIDERIPNKLFTRWRFDLPELPPPPERP